MTRLTEDFRNMMTALRQEIEGEVEGDWYLIETPSGRKRIELLSSESKDLVLKFHSEDGNKATPVNIFRKKPIND